MNYDAQAHRFVYTKNPEDKGHIFNTHSEVAYCGKELQQMKKKLDIGESLRWRKTYDTDFNLCAVCRSELKRILAEQHDIKGW